MRAFGSGHFRLREAPATVRRVYAGFLVLAAVGFLTQAGFQAGRIGITPAAVAAYYRGGEVGGAMAFTKPFGHLLEVTHAHAFMMAVVFLVLAHLFVATAVSERSKRLVLLVAFGGALGDLAGPWLVRYGAAGLAWVELGAWLALWGGGAVMIGVSLRECLARPRPGRGSTQ